MTGQIRAAMYVPLPAARAKLSSEICCNTDATVFARAGCSHSPVVMERLTRLGRDAQHALAVPEEEVARLCAVDAPAPTLHQHSLTPKGLRAPSSHGVVIRCQDPAPQRSRRGGGAPAGKKKAPKQSLHSAAGEEQPEEHGAETQRRAELYAPAPGPRWISRPPRR